MDQHDDLPETSTLDLIKAIGTAVVAMHDEMIAAGIVDRVKIPRQLRAMAALQAPEEQTAMHIVAVWLGEGNAHGSRLKRL